VRAARCHGQHGSGPRLATVAASRFSTSSGGGRALSATVNGVSARSGRRRPEPSSNRHRHRGDRGGGHRAALFLFLFKGNGKEAAGLNPQRAAELAAAAMLSVKELPGSGWRLVEVDATDEDFLGSSLPDTAACDKLAPAVQAVDDVRSARLAKAGRSFERETSSGEEATTVNAEVAVFPDANTIASAFDAFRAAIKSADFDRCVAAIFQEGLSSDESITSKPVNALASVPTGGVAKAYEVDYKSSSEQYVMRFEIYYWRFGNVVAQVGVFGLKDDVGKGLSQAAVDGMASGLDRAAGSNPPTAIPAVVASRTPVRSPWTAPSTARAAPWRSRSSTPTPARAWT